MSQESVTEYNIIDIPKSEELQLTNLAKKNQKIMRVLVKATKKAKENCLDVVEVKGDHSDEEVNIMSSIMKGRGYNAWKSNDGWNFIPKKDESKFNDNYGFGFGKNPFNGPWSGFNFK